MTTAPMTIPAITRPLTIDFLYLDLEVCTRCSGTQANLAAALAEASAFLTRAGVQVAVTSTRVEAVEQAQALGFVTSPTIRIDGLDIAPELRTSRCADCERCAENGPINCRVWVFQGQEYSAAPVAMIVAAIRQAVDRRSLPAPSVRPPLVVPDDLVRFFAGTTQRQATTGPGCCAPAEAATCCEPAAKATCCAAAPAGHCGCQ